MSNAYHAFEPGSNPEHCNTCGFERGAHLNTGQLPTPRYEPQPTEMASLREIKQRLAAIEQGQGVLCERLDALAKEILATASTPSLRWRFENLAERISVLDSVDNALLESSEEIEKKLDCLQGKELLAQFQRGKPKSRRRK